MVLFAISMGACPIAWSSLSQELPGEDGRVMSFFVGRKMDEKGSRGEEGSDVPVDTSISSSTWLVDVGGNLHRSKIRLKTMERRTWLSAKQSLSMKFKLPKCSSASPADAVWTPFRTQALIIARLGGGAFGSPNPRRSATDVDPSLWKRKKRSWEVAGFPEAGFAPPTTKASTESTCEIGNLLRNHFFSTRRKPIPAKKLQESVEPYEVT